MYPFIHLNWQKEFHSAKKFNVIRINKITLPFVADDADDALSAPNGHQNSASKNTKLSQSKCKET